MGDVLIHLVALPGSVKGVTVINGDGDYVIFINSNLCNKEIRITTEHELEHLELNHFQNDDHIGTLEAQASG